MKLSSVEQVLVFWPPNEEGGMGQHASKVDKCDCNLVEHSSLVERSLPHERGLSLAVVAITMEQLRAGVCPLS